MKLIVLTTSDKFEHPGWYLLKESLEYYGYDFCHLLAPFVWGHQMPLILDWCKKYKGDATHFLYTDCFDTIAFAGPDEVIGKADPLFGPVQDYWGVTPKRIRMLISGEKACFPHSDRAKEYPPASTPWKFVNGGGWMVEIEYFKQLCEKQKLDSTINDQVFLMEAYLQNQEDIAVDHECKIFQTIAFSKPEEWTRQQPNGRLMNRGTWQYPVFFHGNGRTNMDWVYANAQTEYK